MKWLVICAVHDGRGQSSVFGLVVQQGQNDLPDVSAGTSDRFPCAFRCHMKAKGYRPNDTEPGNQWDGETHRTHSRMAVLLRSLMRRRIQIGWVVHSRLQGR